MIKKSESNGESSGKKQSPPAESKIETVLPKSAAQLWRDRLNIKLTAQQSGHPGAQRNTTPTNTSNRFGNTSPGSTARKTKKGYRLG